VGSGGCKTTDSIRRVPPIELLSAAGLEGGFSSCHPLTFLAISAEHAKTRYPRCGNFEAGQPRQGQRARTAEASAQPLRTVLFTPFLPTGVDLLETPAGHGIIPTCSDLVAKLSRNLEINCSASGSVMPMPLTGVRLWHSSRRTRSELQRDEGQSSRLDASRHL
jgi:hypothetical protein